MKTHANGTNIKKSTSSMGRLTSLMVEIYSFVNPQIWFFVNKISHIMKIKEMGNIDLKREEK